MKRVPMRRASTIDSAVVLAEFGTEAVASSMTESSRTGVRPYVTSRHNNEGADPVTEKERLLFDHLASPCT